MTSFGQRKLGCASGTASLFHTHSLFHSFSLSLALFPSLLSFDCTMTFTGFTPAGSHVWFSVCWEACLTAEWCHRTDWRNFSFSVIIKGFPLWWGGWKVRFNVLWRVAAEEKLKAQHAGFWVGHSSPCSEWDVPEEFAIDQPERLGIKTLLRMEM